MKTKNTHQPAASALLFICFFLSGFCALFYELTWQRLFLRLVGTTTLANVLTLCLFMGGLALGAVFYNILSQRKIIALAEFTELKIFASLEFLIGTFALASLFFCRDENILLIFRQVRNLSGISPGIPTDTLQSIFLYSLIFLVLIPPTLSMGATLPLIAAHFEKHYLSPAKLTVRAYFANTTGAIFGSICGGILMLSLLGVSRSIMLASSINFFTAGLALFINKSIEKTSPSAIEEQSTASPEIIRMDNFSTLSVYLSVFLSGLIFLAMEVVWTRYLIVFSGSSTFALALVLAVCLLGISAGARIAETLGEQKAKTPDSPPSQSALGLILSLSALALSLNLHQFAFTTDIYLRIYLGLISIIGTGSDFALKALTLATMSTWLVLLPATIIGIIFPYTLIRHGEFKSSGDLQRSFSQHTSKVYSINLLGCIFGAFLTHKLFESEITKFVESNIQFETLVLALITLLIAILFFVSSALQTKSTSKTTRYTAATLLATSFLLLIRPSWNQNQLTAGYPFLNPQEIKKMGFEKAHALLSGSAGAGDVSNKPLYYREAPNTIVAVKESRLNNLRILTSNGKVEAAIPIWREIPSPASDLATHTIMGLAPTILCPDNKQTALVIGFGSGTTFGTVLQSPWVESATVIELDDSIYSIAPLFRPSNLNPLTPANISSGRARTVVADARAYLAMHDTKYNIIISQPSEPWLSGSSNLFTREFFKLSSSRLKDRGIFCQWLQLYAISRDDLCVLLKTFNQSFKDCTILHKPGAGEIILLGSNSKIDSKKQTKVLFKRLDQTRAGDLLGQVGLEDAYHFLSTIISFPNRTRAMVGAKDVTINTDDNLFAELRLATGKNPEEATIDEIINWLTEREAKTLRSDYSSHFDLNNIEKARLALSLASMSLERDGFYTDRLLKKHLLRESISMRSDKTVRVKYRVRVEEAKALVQEIERSDPGLSEIIRERVSSICGEPGKENTHRKTPLALQDSDALSPFARSQLALLYLEAGRTEDARQMANSIASDKVESTTDSLTLDDAARVLLATGSLAKSEQKEACLSLLRRAADISPRSARIKTDLALAMIIGGEREKSSLASQIKLLEETLNLDPNQYIARYALAQRLLLNKNPEAALEQLFYLSKVAPNDPAPAIFALAIYMERQEWQRASRSLNGLNKRFPGNNSIKSLANIFESYSRTEGKNIEPKDQAILRSILDEPIPAGYSLTYK